jgi:MFS family permease
MGRYAQLHDESPRVWRTRNVWAFSLSSLFSDWGHEMFTALLPGFLVGLGAPVFALGLIEGVSNFAQAWSALWGGHINDQPDGRHTVLIVGYILTGVKALAALAFWWPWVVVIRTAAWIGRGARGPIRDAYIAEEVPRQHLGKAYGLRESFDTAGALLGPLTAAILVAFIHTRILVALTAIPAAVTVLMILRVKKLSPPQPVRHHDAVEPAVGWPVRFLRYRVAVLLFASGYLAPTFFILRVWQSGIDVGPINSHTLALLLYTLHNAVYAAAAYPVGRLADRAPGRSLLLVGYAVWSLAILGFALNPAVVAVWIVLFGATGLATAIIEVAQKIVTVGVAPEAARGRGLGQIAAVTGMGQLVASVIMGVLWGVTSAGKAFAVEAAVAFVGLVVMMWALGSQQRETARGSS